MKRFVQVLLATAALGLAATTCQVTCPNGMYAIDTPTGRQYHCAEASPTPAPTPVHVSV